MKTFFYILLVAFYFSLAIGAYAIVEGRLFIGVFIVISSAINILLTINKLQK